MHIAHVLDHLVLAGEAILALAMANAGVGAVDQLERRTVVHDFHVAFEVGVAREARVMDAGGIEADELGDSRGGA